MTEPATKFLEYLQSQGQEPAKSLLEVMQKRATDNREVLQMENRDEFDRLKFQVNNYYTKKR